MRLRPLTTANIDIYLLNKKYTLYDFEEIFSKGHDLYTIQIHHDTSDSGFYLTVSSRGNIQFKKYYEQFSKDDYIGIKRQFGV